MSHWERTNGEEGIPPISPDLDEDLMAMRVAKELNIPVTWLADTPLHWIGAAMISMEWSRVESEKSSKRSRKPIGSRTASRGQRS